MDQNRTAALRSLAETIARTTPRDGESRRHWEALQRRAKQVLRACAPLAKAAGEEDGEGEPVCPQTAFGTPAGPPRA